MEASRNVGCFLRLVGGGGGCTGYLRSNISPFHYVSRKVKGGIYGGHLRLDGSIARICKKLVMPLPIFRQQ